MRRKKLLQILFLFWSISTVAFFLGVYVKLIDSSADLPDQNVIRLRFDKHRHSDLGLVDRLRLLREDKNQQQENDFESLNFQNEQDYRNVDTKKYEEPGLNPNRADNTKLEKRQISQSLFEQRVHRNAGEGLDNDINGRELRRSVPDSGIQRYTQAHYTPFKPQKTITVTEQYGEESIISTDEIKTDSKVGSPTFTEEYQKYLKSNSTRVWPKVREREDRILTQLFHTPNIKSGTKLKRIYSAGDAHQPQGRKIFLDHGCPVSECYLTSRAQHASTADAVLFHGGQVSRMQFNRPPNQIWMWFLLESPHHSYVDQSLNNVINWTLTYRTDSTLVTPYERFTYFNNYTGVLPEKTPKNYAAGKTKKVAWFVSNCWAPNGRLKYVEELQKYIAVDIYGSCGTLECDRFRGKDCDEMLRKDYKFYLSFENSNCKDYITEKFYWNALKNDVLPVVMGARPSDYARVAPPKSFIHIDRFKSPRDLADYLHLLDRSDDLYNSYFRWKETGEYIDTKFWCRVCAMLHTAGAEGRHISYQRLDEWWKGKGVCVDPIDPVGWATWRNKRDLFDYSKSFPHTWIESGNSTR